MHADSINNTSYIYRFLGKWILAFFVGLNAPHVPAVFKSYRYAPLVKKVDFLSLG